MTRASRPTRMRGHAAAAIVRMASGLYVPRVGYKPSDPTEGMPEFAAARAQRAESERLLVDLALVGVGEDEAEQRARAVGLAFRPIYAEQPGQVLTADLSLRRVTATIRAGVVEQVRIG